MNVCERYEIMISALLDGELSERDKAELSAHIAGCERCGALAAAFAAASGAFSEGLEEPPEDLHGAIMERVGAAAKVRRSQTRFMRLRPIIAAAACVAVVAVTLLAANHGLRSAKSTTAGGAESFAAAPEAPSYAGGGSAAMYDADGIGGENAGADPMEAPAMAPDPAPTRVPSGASMNNAPSETRSMNDAAASEAALAEGAADMAEPESEADVPAGLPALEVEAVAAGKGSFTALVVADPSGSFAPGGLLTVFSDTPVAPGTRVTIRYSGAGADYVTAEEIEINE